MGKEIFNEIIDTIENEDLKEFMVNKCMPTIPDWFWEAPAASSGRFHPKTSLGEGGLARHTVALCRILNYMFEIESIYNNYKSRERDLMRIAGLMHDTRKSGSQEDYDQNKQTKFNHPLLAAEVVKNLDGIDNSEKELLCGIIASHMGQFNTSKKYPDIVLPKPKNKYETMVHIADYLSSRKDIEVQIDIPAERKPDINTWRFDFGKYVGKTIPEVKEIDSSYLMWAKDNLKKQPLITLLKQIM